MENPEWCIVHIFEKYLAKHPSQDPKYSKDLYLRLRAKPTNVGCWYSCQPLGLGTLSKVIAKLCHTGSLEGWYSNHSLCSTAATRMYDSNLDEQQITEVTGHKSVAVQNYKCTSMTKQQEVSDILYGQKKKTVPSATVSKAPEKLEENTQGHFDLRINSQAMPIHDKKKTSPITVMPTVNVNVSKVDINEPVLTMNQPKITISPVINLHAQDLPRNTEGHIQLPKIDVALTININ